MATEQQKFELLISVLTQGIQTASTQLTQMGKGLSGSAEDSRELKGDFEKLRAVAATLGSAFQAVSQGVKAAGDTSATTALKYQRLLESVQAISSQLKQTESDYDAGAAKSRELEKTLEELKTAYSGVVDKLKETPKGEAYDKLRQEAARFKDQIDATEKALVDNSKAMADLEKQSGSLAAQQQKLVETLRDEEAALKDVSAAAAQSQVSVNDVGEGIEKVGRTFESLGEMITLAVTVPLVGLAAAAAKFSGDFEASMLKVKAKSGATREEMKLLETQALDLGSKSKFGAKEVAEGQTDLAAAGLSVKQVLQALPDVLNLAVAGELEMSRAAEIATDTMNQFGYEAKDVGRISDILVKAADSSSISVEQLGFTFKYAGPLAKTAGQSLEEMAAATAILGNSGIKGEQAGTVLRGTLAALIDPSKEAEKTLAKLGITVNDSSGKMLPLNQILLQLEQSGASSADIMKIFGQEAGNGMVTLLGKGSSALREMTRTMQDSAGITSTVAKILGSGVMAQVQTVANSLEVVAIKIGQGLSPVLLPLLSYVTGTVLPVLQRIADWFVAQDPKTKALITGIAAILAAIGPVVVVVGGIITAIGGLVTAIGALAGAGPVIGIVAAAIAGLAVIFAETLAVAALWYLAIKNNFAGVRDVIVAVMNQVKGYISLALNEITGFWKANGEKIIYAVRFVLAYWEGLAKPVVAAAGTFIQYVLQRMAEFAFTIMRNIGNAIMLVVNIVNGDLGAAWQNAKNIVANSAMFMANQVINSANLIISAINSVIGWLGIAIPKLERFNILKAESEGQTPKGDPRWIPSISMKPSHGTGGGVTDFMAGLREKPDEKEKPKPPPGGGKGGGGGGSKESALDRLLEAARILKEANEILWARMKQDADNAVRLAADSLEREQRNIQAKYNAKLISAETYYRELAILQDKSSALEVKKIEDTLGIERQKRAAAVSALESLQKGPAKPESAAEAKKRAEAIRDLTKEIAGSDNTISDLETTLTIAILKRGDAAKESQKKIDDAVNEEIRKLSDLQEQYLKLGENEFATRRRQAYGQAAKAADDIQAGLSSSVSSDDPEVQKQAVEALTEEKRAQYALVLQIRDAALAQIEFDERLAAIAAIQAKLKADEEALDREALRLSISQYEVEARKKALREGSADAIERQVAALRQLMAANPTLNNDQNRRSIDGVQNNINDLRFNMSSLGQDVRQNLTQSFQGFFQNLMSGSQGAAEAFRGFVSSVLGGITQMISKLIALWIVQKLVGLAMGFLGGGLGSKGGGFAGGAGFKDGLKFMAKGGTAKEGEPLVVGDGGVPEIFVPKSDGYVFPSMRDLLQRTKPRGMNSGMRAPDNLPGRGGAGNVSNEFLIATLFDPKTLASMMKSKPVKDMILNIVTGSPNTIRKATLGG